MKARSLWPDLWDAIVTTAGKGETTIIVCGHAGAVWT